MDSTYRLLRTSGGLTQFARVTVSSRRVPPTASRPREWVAAAHAGLQAAKTEFGYRDDKYAVASIQGNVVDTSPETITTATFLAVATAEGRLGAFAPELRGGKWTWKKLVSEAEPPKDS